MVIAMIWLMMVGMMTVVIVIEVIGSTAVNKKNTISEKRAMYHSL